MGVLPVRLQCESWGRQEKPTLTPTERRTTLGARSSPIESAELGVTRLVSTPMQADRPNWYTALVHSTLSRVREPRCGAYLQDTVSRRDPLPLGNRTRVPWARRVPEMTE